MARGITRWVLGSVALITIVGVLAARSDGSAASAWRAAPASVALVDLERVLAEYEWVREQEQIVQRDLERRGNRLEGLAREIENRRDDLAEANLPASQRRLKQADLAELEAQYEATLKVAETMRQLSNGEILAEGYLDTLAAIELIAQRDGYDLILLDDRKIVLPKGAPQSRIESAILSRSILFARDSIDVSTVVIDLLNNRHKAGQPIRDDREGS